MNILIVDDLPAGRRLLRAILERERMIVFEAGDGVEALAKLAHDRIDAVITDILMPRMDGFQLCHEIRSSERLHETPVIVYSATYTAAEDEQLAFELGADRFLKKPTPAGVMIETVRECVTHGVSHPAPQPPPAGLALMRNYSERLVAKLETQNLELEAARAELHEANTVLEWRVQQRTAELTAANEQLTSLASFVARDLRGPLRTLSGYARRLDEDFAAAWPAEARRLMNVMVGTAGHAERLTDALLTFCQVGAQPVRRRPVDLNEIARTALAALSGEWKHRVAEVVVHPLPTCAGDPALLEHVFGHLLSNALKFTRGRPAPEIAVGVVEGDGLPELFVRDNGVGFDMRYADRVFEPLQQLHRDDGYEGTGLGLNLVRNIIHRHGGSIRVASIVNRGTTFFFSLEGASRPVPMAPSVGVLAS